MTSNPGSLGWAGTLIALALANWFGLIADKDANILFVILPALWVASGGLGRCTRRQAAA